MQNFTLPEKPTLQETEELKKLVQKFAIQRMGELFRQWKKRLWATYKRDKKPPQFTGYLLQQEENWDKFVEHKNSEDAKARSVKKRRMLPKRYITIKLGEGATELPCLSGLNKSVRWTGMGSLQNPSEKTGT